jgi:hypothetical protein
VKRGNWADAANAAILAGAATRGVISARRLVELGVPESTVYRRCRSGGPWQLLLPAVILLTTGTPTRDQLVTGALSYAGDGALVTGLEACRRHGVRRGPPGDGEVHLLVPHDRHLRSTRFATVERTRRLPDPVVRGGFRLAPVDRAAVDAVRRMSEPGAVTELLSDAVQRGLCSVGALAQEVDSGAATWHRRAAPDPARRKGRRAIRRRTRAAH